jgi:hypothetical protein
MLLVCIIGPKYAKAVEGDSVPSAAYLFDILRWSTA